MKSLARSWSRARPLGLVSPLETAPAPVIGKTSNRDHKGTGAWLMSGTPYKKSLIDSLKISNAEKPKRDWDFEGEKKQSKRKFPTKRRSKVVMGKWILKIQTTKQVVKVLNRRVTVTWNCLLGHKSQKMKMLPEFFEKRTFLMIEKVNCGFSSWRVTCEHTVSVQRLRRIIMCATFAHNLL